MLSESVTMLECGVMVIGLLGTSFAAVLKTFRDISTRMGLQYLELGELEIAK